MCVVCLFVCCYLAVTINYVCVSTCFATTKYKHYKQTRNQTNTHTHINNDSSFVFCLHVCCLFCLFVSLLMLCSGMLGRVESFIGSVGLFVCALFVWEGWYGVVCDCWMLRLDVVRV